MSSEGERALWRAVRVAVVLRYTGELGFVLGLAAIVPVLAAMQLGEPGAALAYGLVGAGLAAVGLLARRLPPPRELQRNEALAVATAVFVSSPLAMSVPLMVHGIAWPDALFEAVSGFTTTGLSTLGSIEQRSPTFLLARAWMQWVGGLGFVVLSLALVIEPGNASRRLGALGVEPASMAASMREHARRVLLVYLALSGLGVGALMLLGASAFDALVHTFAGVSTGGFAPRDDSLAALGTAVRWAVLGLSVLGAVSLPRYHELARGHWRRIGRDLEVRTLLVLAVVVWMVLAAATAGDPHRPALSDLALVSLSAQTTAGFSTFAPAELPDLAKALLIGSMITGGSQGSTAGGMKLLRVLLVLRLVRWLVAETRLPPHAMSRPSLSGEVLEPTELLRAGSVIGLFLAVLVASWLPFLAYGYPPLDALFEVASATGTVGLSVGIARPTLEPLLKAVLCMDMLLGRLEVFAVLVTLSPGTWLGRRV